MNVYYRSINDSIKIYNKDSKVIGNRLEFHLPFYLSTHACGDLGLYRSNSTWQGVIGDRATVLRHFGADPEHTILVKQIHSREVIAISGLDTSAATCQTADGLWGTELDIDRRAAAVTVADCMPIAVYEHVSRSWALLHSGRSGTGILCEAIKTIKKYAHSIGLYSCEFSVCLGPCISVSNYPIDRISANNYSEEWGQSCVIELENGSPAADLRAANLGILQMIQETVPTLAIKDVLVYTDCTYAHPELGSFRREGADKFTRMLAVITKG